MALATGADTYKMKYGHRGGNHPVKDLATGRVYISSQNHGYVVDTDKLDKSVATPAFINVNDGPMRGLITQEKIFLLSSFIQKRAVARRTPAICLTVLLTE